MRSRVGFNPISPTSEAGTRTDPPASDPAAIGTNPAFTAAADPPYEPPALRVVSFGNTTEP